MAKKAVLFDLGGVLFTSPVREISAYEDELGVPRFTLGAAFVRGAPDNAFCRLERGQLTLSQFFPEFERECHELAASRGLVFARGLSAAELFKRISSRGRLVPAMMTAVHALRKAGYRTAAITNNWIDDVHSWAGGGLEQLLGGLFDVVLESCKLGVRKPDPYIFEEACRRLQVTPNEAVFLDDLGPNLKSARQVGMATIKVVEPEEAIAELEQLLGVCLRDQHDRAQPTEQRLASKI